VIEQVMIFALGFLFAGLAALAFAPAFWRRANRLTRRRLETQVPLSVQEILAERDQLRAEFAVEQRRVELRVAQMNLAYAADRGELGRRAVEISALKDNLAQGIQENRELEHALANLQADLSQVSAELAAMTKALYDAEGLNERKQAEFIELIKAHEAMTTLAEERLANHAAADARAVGLELRLGDVSRMLLEAEKRFTERTTQASKLSDALALSKRNLELGESNSVALQRKLEAEAARATEIGKELEALRAQRDEDQDKLRSLTQKLGVNEAVLEDASGREKKIRIQRDQEVEKARNAGRALAEKYEHLKSEYAGLQGALDVARRRCETLEADLSAKRGGRPKKPSEPDEKSAPRQEGQDIGTVVRLPRTGTEPNGAETSGEAEADEKREVRDQVGT
jgi:chromosome segregation ATPase